MNKAPASACQAGWVDGRLAIDADETARSNSVIAKVAFTTEGLPPSEQFDAYRTYCAPVIEILPNERPHSGYEASCEMWMLGNFALRRIRAPEGYFERSALQVRRDGLDHWVFNLVRSGEQKAQTAVGALTTGAGVLSVFSFAGPYEAYRTNIDWLGLFVPRGAFPTIDRALNHNQHLALDNPLGRLFAAYLVSLAEQLPSMTESDLSRAIEATQTIITTCIASSLKALDSGDSYFDMPRLRRVRDIIDQNLGSWNLHTARLCKLAGVSRSNLYRMFEPYGGVVRYIQRQRLLRAHDLLADPTCIRHIGQIANDYCFSDASAFSRAFRHEFGYSPSDVRKWVESGGTPLVDHRSLQKMTTAGSWNMLYQV